MRIWDTLLCQCVMSLSGHLQSVTCVKWGGSDLIYSASQDRTVKVWRGADVIYNFYTLFILVNPLSFLSNSILCAINIPLVTATIQIHQTKFICCHNQWLSSCFVITLSTCMTFQQGTLCRTLQGHGHWVNTMALNTDYVMRTGAFDPADASIVHRDHSHTGTTDAASS